MKITTAKQYLGRIRKLAKSGDSETAHRLEKELWAKTLESISCVTLDHLTSIEKAELASVALDSLRIDFDRWFA